MDLKMKQRLYDYCLKLVSEKMDLLGLEIKKAQESANSDTKSSMGDKYETGRAMAQLEIEKNTHQLAEFQKQYEVMMKIKPENGNNSVSLGSVVITDSANYFISVSAGAITLEDEVYYAVSQQSPVAVKMAGLKVDGEFSMNGKTFVIKNIF